MCCLQRSDTIGLSGKLEPRLDAAEAKRATEENATDMCACLMIYDCTCALVHLYNENINVYIVKMNSSIVYLHSFSFV